MSNQPMHYDYEDAPQDTPEDAVQLYKGALQNLENAPESIVKATNKATKALGGLLAWLQENNLHDQARDVQHAYSAFNDLLEVMNRYENADTNARMAVNMLRAAYQQATMELESLLESARQGNTMDDRLREVVEQAREDIREDEQDFGFMMARENMRNEVLEAMHLRLERRIPMQAAERIFQLVTHDEDLRDVSDEERDALWNLYDVVMRRVENGG